MNTNQEISLDELISGIKNFIFCLDLYKEKINNLNVFPVPDGDTGTNMLLTLRSLDLSDSKTIDVENFLSTLKNSSLMEARGNSGVILSQFFIGLLAAYKKNNSLTLRTLAESIVNAAQTTRESLPNPVDGTLMTVYEDVGSVALKSYSKSKSLSDFLKILSEESIKSVRSTPDKLPILKEADVVDSGGLGFSMMINSWFFSTVSKTSNELQNNLNNAYSEMIAGLSDSVSKEFYDETEEIEWGNCTVFTVKGEDIDIDFQRKKIPQFGKSAVITGDSSLIKVHIHVLDTSEIIDYAKKIGKVENIFIQNMDEQTKEISESRKDYSNINTSIISICEGDGVANLFNETVGSPMHILIGGPKKNPSIKDILEIVEGIESENIIILPNNPNILVTAKKLLEITDRKNIFLVETKSIQQGISSVIYFDDENSISDNLDQMKATKDSIEEASVSISTRNVSIQGKKIKKDDYISIHNDVIIDSFSDSEEALQSILSDMAKRNEIITVIVGHDSIGKNLDNIEENFYEENNEKELTIVDGNQPYYNYFILGE
ncbi:MAG: DAK2 domain-containing protein [Dehalococcoidia bacterium]|nr:DAK2 domain-containing protein [Dehalococcoidia bacterium]|tara:strand:- start:3257 stop:4897 length:1641 start_codon:yes stop_codon:yes gene_type:complete